jgi:hypothetical protein
MPLGRAWSWLLALCAVLASWHQSACSELAAFNTSQARPIALGGAYFSGESEIFSALWNPAAFGGAEFSRKPQFAAWFSPISAVRGIDALVEKDMDWKRDDRLTERETIFSTLWCVKGVSLKWHMWAIGFINSEEPLRSRPNGESVWSGYNGVTGRRYTFALAFKLAPEVALGGSILFDDRGVYDLQNRLIRVGGLGGSFGVLLRPSRWLNVGLTYIQRPDTLARFEQDARRIRNLAPLLADELERVDSRTINGGISAYPWHGAGLFVDVRNLDGSGSFGVAELHVGFEQTFYGLISARAGWYRTPEEQQHVFSGGIGVKDWWGNLEVDRPGNRSDLFAYTFVHRNTPGGAVRWHMIAFIVPIST